MHAVCIWYNAPRSVRWQISGGTKGGYLACGGGIKSIDSQAMRCLVNCSKPEASVVNCLQLAPSATASQALSTTPPYWAGIPSPPPCTLSLSCLQTTLSAANATLSTAHHSLPCVWRGSDGREFGTCMPDAWVALCYGHDCSSLCLDFTRFEDADLSFHTRYAF